MGIIVSVYRNDLGDCTNGGMSSRVSQICVTNVEGPFKPSDDCPAFELLPGHVKNAARLVPLQTPSKQIGPMFGGNYGSTSDSRFGDAVRALTGAHISIVPIHDRFETN